MNFILGIDPGKATGLAMYDLDSQKFVHMEETPNGIKGFKWPFYGLNFANHIACEKFTLRSSNEFVADLSGVEIIGWLKGEGFWTEKNPEPVQHMTLTRLRKNKDKYQDSVITKMMQEAGFKIGEGHCRMAGSVAVWYAVKVLKHKQTIEMLKPRESK